MHIIKAKGIPRRKSCHYDDGREAHILAVDVDGAEVSDADATELLTAFLNGVSEKDYNAK